MDVLKYKGKSPIILAVKQLVDIVNANIDDEISDEFVIVSLFENDNNKRDVAIAAENMLTIYSMYTDPISCYNFVTYTFDNRYCEYHEINMKWDYPVILAVPYDVIIIQRYWRKWFLKRVRERCDPIKKGLMEYIYHPSRINFDLQDDDSCNLDGLNVGSYSE